METPRIHLIEKVWEVRESAEDPNVKESGFWKFISHETAQCLIGGKIYFHLTQKERSYASGRIVGYKDTSDKRADSIAFLFKEDKPGERIYAQNDSWEPIDLTHIDVYPYRQIIGC